MSRLQLVTDSRNIAALEKLVERAKALGVPDTLEPRDDGPGLVLEVPEETVQQIISKLLAAKQGPLYGYHHDQLSPTVHAWAGIQRRADGWGRLWLKVKGDGRQGSVEYRNISLTDHGYATYGACQTTFCVRGPAATVYYVGTWHPVASEVSVKALSVNWRYTGGASTGQRCVASYRVLVWQKTPIASPTC